MNYSKVFYGFFSLVWVILFIFVLSKMNLDNMLYIPIIVITSINYLFFGYTLYKSEFTGKTPSKKDTESE